MYTVSQVLDHERPEFIVREQTGLNIDALRRPDPVVADIYTARVALIKNKLPLRRKKPKKYDEIVDDGEAVAGGSSKRGLWCKYVLDDTDAAALSSRNSL